MEEQGFGAEQLAEMQRIISAENSDFFDVLAHVAYALPPLTREERAARAKVQITAHFKSKQQVFLDFVLSCYVRDGVAELDPAKLTPHGPLYHVTATPAVQLGISSLPTHPSPVLTHYTLDVFGYIIPIRFQTEVI